mgnify:CR=1 FL=1
MTVHHFSRGFVALALAACGEEPRGRTDPSAGLAVGILVACVENHRHGVAADRVGPYRIRLVVTDAHGAASLEQEAVVIAGPQCGDGVDDDLDGRIDTDDPDCDGLGVQEPPSTTVTAAPPSTTAPAPASSPPGSAPVAPGAEPIPGDPRYTG